MSDELAKPRSTRPRLDSTAIRAVKADDTRLRKLLESGHLYRLLVQNLRGMSAVLIDRDFRYVLVEGDGLRMAGFTREMLEGRTMIEVVPIERRHRILPHVEAALDGEASTFEYAVGGRTFEMTAIPVREPDDATAPPAYCLIISVDIQRHHDALAAWMYTATRDGLTGVLNRTAIRTQLAEAMRSGPIAVLGIDLDGFKAVNDKYGHAAGDLVLEAIAKRMVAVLRRGDLVGRLGGDEFLVVLRGPHLAQQVREITGRLLNAVRAPIALIEGTKVQVGCSVGAVIAQSNDDPVDVTVEADKAMYAAKRDGGGLRFARGSAMPDQTILVVDDDDDIRVAVEEVLIDEGYHVVPAKDGQEALEYLRAGNPCSLLLLDLMMPRMDGAQFMRLREHDHALKRIPVALLTASTSVNCPSPEAIVRKPVELSKLVALVAMHALPAPR